MKRFFWVLCFIFLGINCFVKTSSAALLVCQNNVCHYADEGLPLKPWTRKLKTFFKTSNVRLDFCEATADKHLCLYNGIRWLAGSPVIQVGFEIPVARTLPQKNTLLVDYLVRANESLPSCGFSTTTFEEAENYTIRIVSRAFSCDVTGLGSTYLQNTFFVDFIDFDNAVIGAQYTVQTHGEINGLSSGYALIKFRDGNTLKPLVALQDNGPIPLAPTATQLMDMQRQQNPSEDPERSFSDTVSDWWQDLKDALNLDKEKPASHPNQQNSWWNNFTNKLSKIIYLEPLD